MSTEKTISAVLAAAFALSLAACQPADPPPDIIKTQREDLEKARAVKDVQDKAVQEQYKSVDEQIKAADEQAGQGDAPNSLG